MTYEQFAATVGIVAVVTVIVESVKRLFVWSSPQTDRFAPALAVLLGAILGLALFYAAPADVRVGQNPLVAALFGIINGAGAAGIYDVVLKSVFEGALGAHPSTGPIVPPPSGNGPASMPPG